MKYAPKTSISSIHPTVNTQVFVAFDKNWRGEECVRMSVIAPKGKHVFGATCTDTSNLVKSTRDRSMRLTRHPMSCHGMPFSTVISTQADKHASCVRDALRESLVTGCPILLHDLVKYVLADPSVFCGWRAAAIIKCRDRLINGLDEICRWTSKVGDGSWGITYEEKQNIIDTLCGDLHALLTLRVEREPRSDTAAAPAPAPVPAEEEWVTVDAGQMSNEDLNDIVSLGHDAGEGVEFSRNGETWRFNYSGNELRLQKKSCSSTSKPAAEEPAVIAKPAKVRATVKMAVVLKDLNHCFASGCLYGLSGATRKFNGNNYYGVRDASGTERFLDERNIRITDVFSEPPEYDEEDKAASGEAAVVFA